MLIVVGYGIGLLLMSPLRDFVYVDDWVFTRAAEKIVQGQGFAPSEYGQQTLVTHAYWGALFDWLLGLNLTSVVLANMAMSMVAALAFFALLRRAGLPLSLSSLGVALLMLNPFFLTLSYSFMTEITFLALLLLSCLCYFEGLRNAEYGMRNVEGWLWLGSGFAALAFLTRQFGLAAAAAAFLWMLLARGGAESRRYGLARLAAAVFIPATAAAGYFAWSSGFAPTYSGSVARADLISLVSSPGAWAERVKSLHFALPQLGLSMPLFLRVRHWKLAAPLAVASAVAVAVQGMRRADAPGATPHVAEPFALAQPFRLEFTALWWVGAALAVWIIFVLAESAWPRLVELRHRRAPQPVEFLYLTGLILLVGTFLARTEFYTRYMLPVVPFAILAGLLQVQHLRAPTRRADTLESTHRRPPVVLAAMLALLLIGGAASVALHLDDYDFLAVRWEAGHALGGQGVAYTKINNGFSWDAYYLYDEALRQTKIHDMARLSSDTVPELIIDPQYLIGTNQILGYHVFRTYRYFSRLDGFTAHDLYVLKRDD